MGFLSDLLDKLLGNKETVIATRKADSSPIRSSVKESTEKQETLSPIKMLSRMNILSENLVMDSYSLQKRCK